MDRYSGPEKFSVVEIDVPEIGDDDVLVRYRLGEHTYVHLTNKRIGQDLRLRCVRNCMSVMNSNAISTSKSQC